MVAELLKGPRATRLAATLDRALHPMRRRRTARALRAMPAPQSILVLCHGNLCRSPFAAAILTRELARVGTAVSSAGIAPSRATSPIETIDAARRRDVSLDAHVARRATHAMVAQADLVVVMDATQARVARDYFGAAPRRIVVLGDCDPERGPRRTIADPINGSADDYDACYARIERCAVTLAGMLTPSRAEAGEADSVADAEARWGISADTVAVAGSAPSGMAGDFLDGRITRAMARAVARAASLTMDHASTTPGIGSPNRNSS